jgi:hypothetical protein
MSGTVSRFFPTPVSGPEWRSVVPNAVFAGRFATVVRGETGSEGGESAVTSSNRGLTIVSPPPPSPSSQTQILMKRSTFLEAPPFPIQLFSASLTWLSRV